MALKSNIKRNPSYVESIDDEYLSSPLSPPPLVVASSSSSTSRMAAKNDNSMFEESTQKPGPVIFHRKMFSADVFGNSSVASAATPTSAFEFSTSRSNTFDHSTPTPNYYQLALQQEEENRHRQDLFSLIYSSSSPTSSSTPLSTTTPLAPIIAPPNHPPPSIPITTPSETLFLESSYYNPSKKLKINNSIILNNNLRPPAFKHLRSVSTDASFESSISSSSQYPQRFEEEEFEGDREEINKNYNQIESNICEDSFNELRIDLNNFYDNQIERMKPPLEMAKEKRKLVVLNDLEKNSNKDFSLSVDENFSPQGFKSIPSSTTASSTTPPPTSSSSSISNSPSRSQSAPPKPHQHRMKEATTSTTKKTTKNGQKHLKIDEENGGNSHELSLFFCSPTVSNSFDMSMDLMNTSEMINDDNEIDEEEHDVNFSTAITPFSNSSSASEMILMPSKSGNIFTFDEKDVIKNQNQSSETTNIQSRPLPPLPNNNNHGNEDIQDIPDEPEDLAPELELEMIPEPEYAYVDGEEGYEAIHHQRSISDHVLSYNQHHQIDEKMKTADFLKKSNSDRSERRSIRQKPPTTNLSIEQYPPSSEEEEHRKLSNISEHRKTISCSTPSFHLQPSIDGKDDDNNDETDDGRKRSITTDFIQSPPPPPPTIMPSTSSMTSMATMKQSIPNIGSYTVRGSTKMPPTRKSSDQQHLSASVRLRDCSKSVSTIGSSNGTDTKQRLV